LKIKTFFQKSQDLAVLNSFPGKFILKVKVEQSSRLAYNLHYRKSV